jgi:hypothetical protein
MLCGLFDRSKMHFRCLSLLLAERKHFLGVFCENDWAASAGLFVAPTVGFQPANLTMAVLVSGENLQVFVCQEHTSILWNPTTLTAHE